MEKSQLVLSGGRMWRLMLVAGVLLGPSTSALVDWVGRVECEPDDQTIFQYNATNIYGNETIPFDRYKGKVSCKRTVRI